MVMARVAGQAITVVLIVDSGECNVMSSARRRNVAERNQRKLIVDVCLNAVQNTDRGRKQREV